jgi:hypothetical protein
MKVLCDVLRNTHDGSCSFPDFCSRLFLCVFVCCIVRDGAIARCRRCANSCWWPSSVLRTAVKMKHSIRYKIATVKGLEERTGGGQGEWREGRVTPCEMGIISNIGFRVSFQRGAHGCSPSHKHTLSLAYFFSPLCLSRFCVCVFFFFTLSLPLFHSCDPFPLSVSLHTHTHTHAFSLRLCSDLQCAGLTLVRAHTHKREKSFYSFFLFF